VTSQSETAAEASAAQPAVRAEDGVATGGGVDQQGGLEVASGDAAAARPVRQHAAVLTLGGDGRVLLWSHLPLFTDIKGALNGSQVCLHTC
jgi:hypothetical protein